MKKYKLLTFAFCVFHGVLIILDALTFVMENQTANWFMLHFLYNFLLAVPYYIVYRFGSEKTNCLVFGVFFMLQAIALALTNPVSNMAPPIFLSMGYWALMERFDTFKKYGIHIVSLCLLVGFSAIVSIQQSLYNFNLLKNILVYVISIPIGGLLLSNTVRDWLWIKLQGEKK